MASIFEAVFGSNDVATTHWQTCCRQGCGAMFAFPYDLEQRFRKTHEIFHCPFGHAQHYTADNKEEELRRELAREKHTREQLETSRRQAWDAAEKAKQETAAEKRKASAARGVVTRIKHRVGNGVCPCCNRFFKALHEHMSKQHPEFQVTHPAPEQATQTRDDL